MVLESLLFPLKAEKKPWEMFFIGMLYATVGVFLSLWIFEKEASFIMVFLTVMACIPIVYNTMILEEGKDLCLTEEGIIMKEHHKALKFLVFLFLGIMVAYVFWYVVLPSSSVGSLFGKQAQTITDINNQIAGKAASLDTFFRILFNNIKVLSFALLFSFIYGAGAIFILTWNASVIGAAIGNVIRSNIASYAASTGAVSIGAYFNIVSFGFLRYIAHGLPEITAYFYGGLAGGIISVAVAKHHFSSKNFSRILIDTSELIMLALVFLFVAALIEVYITPVLF